MASYITHITENLKLGIDFYGIQVAQTGVAVSGDLAVSASATRIRNASTIISITSDLLISGTEYQYERIDIHSSALVSIAEKKIAFTSASTSFSLSTSANSLKIAKTNTDTSGNLSASFSAIEIQKALSEIAINSNVSSEAKSFRNAGSSIAISSNASINASQIFNAKASISGVTVVVTAFKEVVYAKANIAISTPSLLINLIKFKSNGTIDTSNYQTLFVLDNSPLTNQGRTYSSDLGQVFIENKNWNNQKSRYYKRSDSAGRKTFNLSWTYLPNAREYTVDRRHARDFLKKISKDADIHTLKMINDDSDHTTPYTETEYQVYVKDYSETLIRRDLTNGVYYWDCNMTLEEA